MMRMGDELSDIEYIVLRKVDECDAYWTSDIAHMLRMPTPKVLAVLKRLEKYGEVERVVEGGKGRPTSWRKTA